MKDTLDEFIKNNREAFDEEAPVGHYERFCMRMQSEQRYKKAVQLYMQIAVAASLVILFSLHVFLIHNQPENNKIATICEQTVDMKSCYRNKMDNLAVQIQALAQNMDAWNRQIVYDEVENIITSVDDIEYMLPYEISEQETKQIMAEYYQQSLESLENIAYLVNENNKS